MIFNNPNTNNKLSLYLRILIKLTQTITEGKTEMKKILRFILILAIAGFIFLKLPTAESYDNKIPSEMREDKTTITPSDLRPQDGAPRIFYNTTGTGGGLTYCNSMYY